MEERRRGGFRVKPSFGQVLGYIQEGEPLALDLPNRNASTFTASHFWLDDYPNASEPLEAAAAFETADEGYEGVPFPRPPREFTRPSFLPDSDDGGTDPGQALRNDGLNPPRPPTLGGRMRESGIQAAEAIVAGGAAGAAAAAVRSVSENQTMLALRGGGDWLDRTLRIPRRPPGLAPPPDEVPAPQIIDGPRKWSPCCRGRGSGRRRWSARRRGTSRASLPSSSRKRKHRKVSPLLRRQRREQRKRQPRQRPVREPWRCWAREPGNGGHGGLAALPSREQVLPSSVQLGLSKGGSMRLRI